MIILYIVFGMWIGVIYTYFQWYKPMSQKIESLQEGMHDCIKAGLIGPTNYSSKEKDMD